MTQRAAIVLGGGPSGLGAAWGLSDAGAKNIIVVEKAARLGGLSGSFEWRGCRLDYGPHRFSPEFPDLVEKLRAFLGDDWREVPNEHAVQFRNHRYRYPPKVKDFLNWGSVSFSSQVLSSYAWHKVTTAFDHDREESFQAVITDSFGPVLFDEVVSPLCQKVWGSTDKLQPEFAKVRFSVPTFVQWGKKLLHAKSTFSDQTFFYPRLGFQQIWDTLAHLLTARGVRFIREAYAEDVRCTEGRVDSLAIVSPNGRENLSVESLISTIPAEALIKLLPPNPKLQTISGDFQTRGMLLVNFLIRKPQTLPKRVVIFPEAKFPFNRLSEQNQFSPDTVIAGHSVVQADILTDTHSPLWVKSDAHIIADCVKGMVALGLVREEEIVDALLVRVPTAYPVPSVNRERAQQTFGESLAGFENLISTGRFASSDYNNSHTALKKGYLAGELLAARRSAEWAQLSESLRHLPIRD